jgi:predicted acylesterase/phospholipase RssA
MIFSDRKKSTIGLSLNSAFFGFYAHAGFMLFLEEIQFQPKLITGCSAGAIIAALFASEIPMKELVEELAEFKKKDFWEGSFFSSYTKPLQKGFNNYTGHLTGSKLRKFLSKYLGNRNIEDLKIKLGIAVSNLSQKKRELLTKGNLVDAVIASSAFPLLFEIQKIQNEEYTDGGLVDHEPIKEMILDKSIQKIITHRIYTKKQAPKNALVRAINSGLGVIESETDDLKSILAKNLNKKVIRLNTETYNLNPNSLDKGKENIALGYETAKKYKKIFQI